MTESSLEKIETADVVIGIIPASNDLASIESAIARISESTLPMRVVLVHPPYVATDSGPGRNQPQWQSLPDSRLIQDRAALSRSFGDSFAAIFEIAQRLKAGACAIFASDLSTIQAAWIERLVNPIVNGGFDLIAPRYALDPFEGLINRAVVYPLVRALYGKRIRHPLGPDFGISGQLLNRMAAGTRPRLHPLVSLVSEALSSNMKICQANLSARAYVPLDWVSPGPFLAQVLGALFVDVERFAAYWQRGRGSQPITEFGNSESAGVPGPAPDAIRLIDSFQKAAVSLLEVWGAILPPSTLVELRKLARQEAASFRIPDETWARIVYDFALAHRIRPARRDQMLRTMAPIYQAWAASYLLEIAHASPEAVEQRIEELCLAFENTKPYFVSRWRWPDRFNP